MTQRGYTDFVEAFERLSPYELDHFCRIFFNHYSKHTVILENYSLRAADVREIVIASMQAAQLEIAERRMEEAQLGLAMTRSRMMLKETNHKEND